MPSVANLSLPGTALPGAVTVTIADGDALKKQIAQYVATIAKACTCLLYTSPSPRDRQKSRMPSSA